MDLLKLINELAPKREIAVARELTKKFEEIRRGTAEELSQHWKEHEVKGELVVLISGESRPITQEWQSLSPEEHVELLEKTYHLSRHEAIKLAAEARGVPKRHVYNKLHASQEQQSSQKDV